MANYRKWAWSGSRDPFLDFGALIIYLERMKLDFSNLVCRLIVVSSSVRTTDYLSKECVYGHVTSLFFWEITDNTSETVPDRDIVMMED